MTNEQFIKERIIGEAWERFIKYGYSKLIIDELAAELGISKKTIYKFFPSKKDLVKALIVDRLTEAEAVVRGIVQNDRLEYVEKLKSLVGHIGGVVSQMGSIPQDIQKNAPEIWPEIDEIRERLIVNNIRNLLQEGIERGIIKNDIDREIVVLIFINCIRTIVNPGVLSELSSSMKETFETIIKVIFNGILTESNKI